MSSPFINLKPSLYQIQLQVIDKSGRCCLNDEYDKCCLNNKYAKFHLKKIFTKCCLDGELCQENESQVQNAWLHQQEKRVQVIMGSIGIKTMMKKQNWSLYY